MKGPVEPVHRSVPETIQEVIELTGFLCFLFRSTPKDENGVIQIVNPDAEWILVSQDEKAHKSNERPTW